MTNEEAPCGLMSEHFRTGIEDVVILPLVAIAMIVKRVLRSALTILIHIIDFLFPILLQFMRFPLFSLRILGDAAVGLLKGIAQILPIGGLRRAAWRELISRHWASLRQKISYRAFEEAVHHAFENGMAWVFRKCRTLTPTSALLVILAAILWLPISFGVATLMHVALIAKAALLPAWMQFLHLVATIVAKSKLLVLPAYPAAWPQARRHPSVQSIIQFWRFFTTLYLVRKTRYRYREFEDIFAKAAAAPGIVVSESGLRRLFTFLLVVLNKTAALIGERLRSVAARVVAKVSAIPVFGAIVRNYKEHYDEASLRPAKPLSDRASALFSRWSIKFSADYYVNKEKREEAMKRPASS